MMMASRSSDLNGIVRNDGPADDCIIILNDFLMRVTMTRSMGSLLLSYTLVSGSMRERAHQALLMMVV